MAHLQLPLAFHIATPSARLRPPAPLRIHRRLSATSGRPRCIPPRLPSAWAPPPALSLAFPPCPGSTASTPAASDTEALAHPHCRVPPLALSDGSRSGGSDGISEGSGCGGGSGGGAPPPPLPPSVGVVIDAATRTPVVVVGVMHGMPASVADVAAVVGGGAGGLGPPAAVVLELCGSRYAALCGREARHSAPVVRGAGGRDSSDGTADGAWGDRGRARLELQPPLPPLPVPAAIPAASGTGAAAAASDGAVPAVVGGLPAGVPSLPTPPAAVAKASPAARFGRIVVRFGSVGAALFAIGLSSLTGVQQAAGMDPGCEFKEAARRAGEVGAPVVLGDNDASVTVRRLYAAFSPLAAVRHFRADAAEAIHRLTTRPARGVSLLGVFGRPRYAVDVGRLLVPMVVVSVLVQLAANALAGGALTSLFGGQGVGPAAGDLVAVSTAVPSLVAASAPSTATVIDDLGLSAGLVANAWLASTSLRFLNTLVTERDEVLYGSLRGSVAAVAPELITGERVVEAGGEVQAAAGDVRPVVAVVGLLHVNGILRRWEAANAEWEAARATDAAPSSTAPLRSEGGGTNGGERP
ncbi:hypothetical protein MMPV_002132 [Pyropia vietnamensis]